MTNGVYIGLADMRQGMRVMKPVKDKRTGILLLRKGEKLTKEAISNLLSNYSGIIDTIFVELHTEEKSGNLLCESKVKSYVNESVKEFKGLDVAIKDICDRIRTDRVLYNNVTRMREYDQVAKTVGVLSHSISVAILTYMYLQYTGMLDRYKEVVDVALLHDIGKVEIPHDILGKKGKVTDGEFEKIKEHPTIGYYEMVTLKKSEHLLGILDHHERINQTGYPSGKGECSISFAGRLLAVVDTFDAITTKRIYRVETSKEDALNYIDQKKDILYDREIVENFIRMFNDSELY